MQVTIAVPTRNRLKQLERGLFSLATAISNAQSLDILVVDNGSGSAKDIVDDMRSKTGIELGYTIEPTVGLSRARNRALAEARGELVAFLDDDCVVDASYMLELQSLLEMDGVDFWFGPIVLGDPRDARIAIDEDLSDWCTTAGAIARPGIAQGANLVVRRRIAKSVGGFDERLGPGAGFRCEDVDFVAKMLRTDAIGAHVGALRVTHFHGRRHGSAEHRQIDRTNAYGIGAFYAKQILGGDRRYVSAMVSSVLSLAGRYGRRLDLKLIQLAGSAAYISQALSRGAKRRTLDLLTALKGLP